METGAFQRHEQIHIEREVGDAQRRMNFFHGFATHQFARALRVLDVQPEKQFDDGMKTPADEAAQPRLLLEQDGIRQPARADDAIRLADFFHQFQKRVRRRRAVGIHIADQIRVQCQFKALDERAALADRLLEFQRPNRREFRRDALDHPERIVGAAVEHDDELEFAEIMRAKELRVVAQHRFDAALLVVSRNEKQQTVVRHTDSIA